jgi:hypothetical protein
MSSTTLGIFLAHCTPLLGVVALICGALWVGILFSVSWLSGRARWMADNAQVGMLALALNRRWATPCLVVSLATACLWLSTVPNGLLQTPWIVGAGAALVAMLLVHTSVAARTRHIARGSVSATRGEGMRRLFLVLSLVMFAAIVTFRVAGP